MGRTFFKDIQPFVELSDAKKKKYRVGGGCQQF